jgi:hypothetical protein
MTRQLGSHWMTRRLMNALPRWVVGLPRHGQANHLTAPPVEARAKCPARSSYPQVVWYILEFLTLPASLLPFHGATAA